MNCRSGAAIHAAAVLSAVLLLILTTVTAVAQAPNPAPDPNTVIVQGDPPLTQDMVNRFSNLMEWAFEAPLTSEQRTRMGGLVVEAWKKNSRTDIDGTIEILKAEAQIATMPAEQRDLVRAKIQPEILKNLRADRADPVNRWLLEIYDAAHVQIAPGNPPLTRQMSDALAEMFAFVAGEVAGQPFGANQQFKDDWSRLLAAQYPKLPAEQQAQWAQSPVIWASLRIIWARAEEKDRAALRKLWAESLQGMLVQLQQRAAVEESLKDLARLANVRQKRVFTPAEVAQAVKDLQNIAQIVRSNGGEDGARQADQLERAAIDLRSQAIEERRKAQEARIESAANKAARPASKTNAGGRIGVVETMAKIQANHNAFMSIMNTSMQLHYSRINNINTLGGNPYRYVNAYGRPY